MAIAKITAFTQEEQDLAMIAKVMGHPARIAILNVLAKEDGCICGKIVDVLPLAQSTVSQHLKELKKAGLIKGTVVGPKSCYCINWHAVELFKKQFNALFASMQVSKEKACC